MPPALRIIAGIVCLMAGVIFPMGMTFWLNGRMHRQPPPSPRQIGLALAFNGVLPVTLILVGLGILSTRLWATPALRIATGVAAAATVVVLLALAWESAASRRGGVSHGG